MEVQSAVIKTEQRERDQSAATETVPLATVTAAPFVVKKTEARDEQHQQAVLDDATAKGRATRDLNAPVKLEADDKIGRAIKRSRSPSHSPSKAPAAVISQIDPMVALRKQMAEVSNSTGNKATGGGQVYSGVRTKQTACKSTGGFAPRHVLCVGTAKNMTGGGSNTNRAVNATGGQTVSRGPRLTKLTACKSTGGFRPRVVLSTTESAKNMTGEVSNSAGNAAVPVYSGGSRPLKQTCRKTTGGFEPRVIISNQMASSDSDQDY